MGVWEPTEFTLITYAPDEWAKLNPLKKLEPLADSELQTMIKELVVVVAFSRIHLFPIKNPKIKWYK